jgi:hypothetical protein
MLSQGVDGLFGADLGTTLAAVAALVARGYTHREGLFRAELRRTVGTLKSRLPSLSGDTRTFAALALALLAVAAGEAAPQELPPAIASTLASLSTADLLAARAVVRAALAAAPAGWRSPGLANEIAVAFLL